MKRIAVLVSGGGTNLQALINAQGSVIRSGENGYEKGLRFSGSF